MHTHDNLICLLKDGGDDSIDNLGDSDDKLLKDDMAVSPLLGAVEDLKKRIEDKGKENDHQKPK